MGAGDFFPDGAGTGDCGSDACTRAFRGTGHGDAGAGEDLGRFLRPMTVGWAFFKGRCPLSFLVALGLKL